MNNRVLVIINPLSTALLATPAAQVLHEAFHGLAAVLVGAHRRAFNLFAML